MEEQKNTVIIEGKVVGIEEALSNVKSLLSQDLSKKIAALPSDFDKERFTLNTTAMLRSQLKDYETAKRFAKISHSSILTCFEKAAFLGLDFFNKECYAIPYGESLNFQTDYKGEIKLCKAYSTRPILDIFAKVVRKGDEYKEEVIDGEQKITFIPKPFSTEDIVGVFAVVKYRDGSMSYESMSVAEIEAIRNSFSKAPNSAAWNNAYGEMCKKTVLRRLSKMIDKNFSHEQAEAYLEDGNGQTGNNKIIDIGPAEVVQKEDPFKKIEENAQKEKLPVPDEHKAEELKADEDPDEMPFA